MIKPRWYKVIDDLWANKGRTVLVVLAIAVGVMLFGGVFMSQEVMSTVMAEDFLETNPATITMILSPFEDDLLHAVQDLPEVESATAQINFPVKLLLPDGETYNLTLIALDNYDDVAVNQVTPESGAWPPARRDVILERTTVPIANVSVGETIQIELPDGEQRELTVSGTAHSLHVFPAALALQGTGYVSLETLQWLGHSGLYNQLNIATPPGISDIRTIDITASTIKKRVEADDYVVGSITTKERDENILADQINGVTTFLIGIGGFSLILSAFLVINTISAVLAQQKRQIGMLKSVGATGGQVRSLYLTLVGAFGVLALIVALPLGILTTYTTVQAVLSFGNFNFDTFWISPRVVLMMVGTAVAAPLLAALVPITNGTRVTVREAISDYGIGIRKQQSVIDRVLGAIRGLPRPIMLSLRNTFRQRGRLFLTLGALTLAGSIFIGVLSTRDSLLAFLDEALNIFGYDLQLALDDDYLVSTLEREAFRIPGVTAAEGWVSTNAQIVRTEYDLSSTVSVTGLPPDTVFVSPEILEGRWLETTDDRMVVVSIDLFKDENLSVGQTIEMRIAGEDSEWIVVGAISSIVDSTAYVPFDELSTLQGTPDMASRLNVGTAQHDESYQSAVLSELEERLKTLDVGVGASITQSEIVESNISSFNFITSFMLTFAIFLGIVGGLGLTSTMSLNVLERTREIGVMRGIGASNGALRGIVLTEGLIVAFISWVLSAIVSIPMSWLLRTTLGIALFGVPSAPAFSYLGLLIWLPLVLLLAMIASLIPARRAGRISVREALAYE